MPQKSSILADGVLSSTLAKDTFREEYNGSAADKQPLLAQGNDIEWELGMNRLFQGATVSGIIV